VIGRDDRRVVGTVRADGAENAHSPGHDPMKRQLATTDDNVGSGNGARGLNVGPVAVLGRHAEAAT
jgi:hypothetical protein